MSLANTCLLLGLVVLAYMSFWFCLALYTKRYDVVDSAWGLGFIVIAWANIALNNPPGLVQIVSAVLVTTWGLRLFAHIAQRNWRKPKDDLRYEELRLKWGRAEKRKAYVNVFMLQGFLLLLISTPMTAIARADGANVNIGVIIGWVVWLFGIVFETLADYQLARFIKQKNNGTPRIMATGLWHFSRHPNYFGEVTTWWGASIVSLSVGGWWGIAGALAITILITKVSGIPPLERHYKNNPDYQAYAQKTSVLVPWLPKK